MFHGLKGTSEAPKSKIEFEVFSEGRALNEMLLGTSAAASRRPAVVPAVANVDSQITI